MTRFRLKNGSVEFELEGAEEFVERQLNMWMPPLLGLFGSAEHPENSENSENSEAVEVPHDPAPIRVERRIDLADFLKLKQPSTSVEHLLALAYYLERYEQKTEYEAEELKTRWPESSAPWDQALVDHCVASGYLEATSSGFTLTFTGEQFVQGGF